MSYITTKIHKKASLGQLCNEFISAEARGRILCRRQVARTPFAMAMGSSWSYEGDAERRIHVPVKERLSLPLQ